MKLKVVFERISNQEAEAIEYVLGPTADDEFIVDPRDQVAMFEPGTNRRILPITINVHPSLTVEQVAEELGTFAFRLSDKIWGIASERKSE